MKAKSTMVELVTELEKLRSQVEHNKDPHWTTMYGNLTFMINEAKAGEYHDFKNVKYTCGKMASSQMLRKLGFGSLAKRIEQGEFDETADEEDKASMRKDLIENGGESLIDALGLNDGAA